MEICLESTYDRIRRPIKRCDLKLAVTQNVLLGHPQLEPDIVAISHPLLR